MTSWTLTKACPGNSGSLRKAFVRFNLQMVKTDEKAVRLKGTNPHVPSSPMPAESCGFMVHRAAQSSCGDASDSALPASLTLKFSQLTSPPSSGSLGASRSSALVLTDRTQSQKPPVWWPWGIQGAPSTCLPCMDGSKQTSSQAGHARGALESEDSMGRVAMPHPTSCVTMGKSRGLAEPRSLFCKKRATIVFLSSGACEEETTEVKYLAPRPVLRALVIPVKHVG